MNFVGTYQKSLVWYCLQIQNAWYDDTLVRYQAVPNRQGLFEINMAHLCRSTKIAAFDVDVEML